MALVDSSGRAVRSGSGRAIGSGSSSGNNNSSGDGRAANRARSSANLAAAKAAAARNAAAVETQRRNQDGQSQIKAAEAQALAQQQAVQQAAANRKMQEQIAAAEKQAQQNQQGIAAYKAMMEAPAVATTPTAPTQFTQGRSGTSYYPANAPDTMFRGLMGNITGGGLVSGAADLVGEDSYVGGLLKAYSEFDPLGDFAQQTVYGMNDVAKQEYMRQEASNPDWPMMSEKERVQLARKPQMDNQLPHAFIHDGISSTANEAQLNAMRPMIKDLNMSDAQWNGLPIEMKRHLALNTNAKSLTGGGANQGDNPFIPPVEEVAPESYSSYMTDYSPMFSFAGKSGLSSFAEGGEVESQGVGRLFEDMHQPAPMDPILEHHYKNLAQGKAVQHEDGTVSTVYTIQEDIDGVPTLIPTVWDGQILSNDAAIQRALASGKNWPTAPTHPELREYDIKLHENMQNMPAEAAQMMLMQR